MSIRSSRIPLLREVAHIRRQPRERPAIRSDAQDLRADVRGDSAPGDPARILVREIQPARLRPIDAEFVMVMARGDVRMPARQHVGIHANRHRGSRAAHRHVPRRFAEQHLEFRAGFDVEEQDSAARARAGIAQRVANLVARLAHARENDAAAGNADAPQAVELAAGNDVEAAARAARARAAPRDSNSPSPRSTARAAASRRRRSSCRYAASMLARL